MAFLRNIFADLARVKRLPDQQVELTNFGLMDAGAPAPILLLGEHRAALGYYLNDTPVDWDGKTVHLRDPNEDVSPMALIEIEGIVGTKSFPTTQPDHEHPEFPGVFECVCEIKNSNWAERACFNHSKHLVFAFHDTVIEFLCSSYEVYFVTSTSFGLVPRMRSYVFD